MQRFHAFLQNYLLIGFPFTLFLIVWQHFWPMPQPVPPWFDAVTDILAWNLIVWFMALLVFFVMLTVVPAWREKTLRRIANFRERDERERQITGIAARNTYISMLSLLLVLLFLSLFSINYSKVPLKEQVDGKAHEISIGMYGALLDQSGLDQKTVFAFNHIPLSKTGIILLILVWQIGSYHWNARREMELVE